MKSIGSDPRNHAAEGDERIRTAVPDGTNDPVYEQPEAFTFQVQGKGVSAVTRVPGWVAAALIKFAFENKAERGVAS